MFKKMLQSLAIAGGLLLFVVGPVFAGNIEVREDGTTEGIYTQLNFTGDVNVTGTSTSVATITIGYEGGYVNEVLTVTSDTVTAADSPRRFIYTNTTGGTITLPAAAAGLAYGFVEAQGVGTWYVDPQDTDTIVYLNPPMSAGDKLQSPGTSGDNIYLLGTDDNKWYVINVGATDWTDAD